MPARSRLTAAVLAAAALGAVVVPAAADARQPTTVKVGSTGNAAFDDICRQMGDLINNEIMEGINQEVNGNFGEANAWYNQAQDHIDRAQGAGCVMSSARVATPRTKLQRVNGATISSSSTARRAAAKPIGPRPVKGVRGTSVMAKRISGQAGGGKDQFSQATCDQIAGWVNSALDHQQSSAQSGDPGAAAGWRQHANELLAAGRGGGCSWSAS